MATTKRELTDDEILERIAAEKAERERLIAEARANLAKYGTALAPIAGVTLASSGPPVVRLAPRAKARAADPKWEGVVKTCPHCGETKSVLEGFGVVVIRGHERAAGWCKLCRSSTNYHARERVQGRTPKATGAGPGCVRRKRTSKT